jgi:hypothetical protein
MADTGFSDPDDDFITFLRDEWENHTTTPDDNSEFNKFLFEFYKVSLMFGENSKDESPDDPFGIMGT